MEGVCIVFNMEINGEEKELYKIKLDAEKAEVKVGLKVSKCDLKLD